MDFLNSFLIIGMVRVRATATAQTSQSVEEGLITRGRIYAHL